MSFKLQCLLCISFLLFSVFTFGQLSVANEFINYQETNDGLLVNVDVPNISIEERHEGNEKYAFLKLPGASFTKQPGYPRLPFISFFLKAPQNSQFEIKGTESVVLDGHKVYPWPKHKLVNGRVEERFYLDQSAYELDRYYPVSPIVKGLKGKFRDDPVLQLRVFPVQYNPATGRLKYYNKLKLLLKGVNFSDLMSQSLHSTLQSEEHEIALAPEKPGLVLFPTELRRSYRVDYLIITPSQFMSGEELRKLAEWRSSYNGFNVAIVSVQEIYAQFSTSSSQPNSIKTFIRHAYNYWYSTKMEDNHLGYVLLVGDVELIPPCPSDLFLLGETVPSDNGYASVSGDDFIPDIAIGRFPVKDSSELKTIIKKTVQYEKEPPKGKWANRALLISGTVKSLEETMELSREKFFIPSGYDVTSISALKGDDWSDVVRQINRGQLVIEYVGHGWVDGWELFKKPEIAALNNEGMYPVISSLSCNTARYDAPNDSLAEIFVKAKNKGAVAFLGASRKAWVSDLGFGFSRAISQKHLYILGHIVLYTKINLIAESELDLELYNLMGDPALDIYAPRREEDKYDLAVSPEDIQVSPSIPKQGELAKLLLTIHNIGTAFSYESEVEVYLDEKLLDRRAISNISSGETYKIELDWRVPTGVGEIEFSVNVDSKTGKVETYHENNSAHRKINISLEKEGYPINVDAGTPLASCIDDLDGDGVDEIIIAYISYPEIHLEVRTANGEIIFQNITKTRFRNTTGWNSMIGPFPSAGDINGDGRKEVIFAPLNGYLYAWNSEGEDVLGFPLKLGRTGSCTPALVDLDRDGILDIVLALPSGEIHAFRYDRHQRKPIELEGWGFSIRKNGMYSGIAAGDIDGDDSPEVFAGYTDNISKSSIFAWTSDGSIIEGFPIRLEEYIDAVPTVADLDADGKGEIVVISNGKQINLFNINGEIKTSWNIQSKKKRDYLTHPILADLDNDGDLEIIASARLGNLYAWHHDGRLVYGYPQHNERASSPPLFVDVNGDGKGEVISAGYGITLKAYQNNGTLVPGWSVKMNGSRPAHIAAGDVDGDGKIELIVEASSDEIHLLDTLGIPNKKLDWRCFGLSPKRTSYYGIRNSPLLPPTSVRAEDVPGDKGRKINIRWQPPEDSYDVNGYNIYRSPDREGKYIFIARTPKSVGSFVDEQVQNNKEYWYIVRSTDGKYLSAPTSPVSAVAANNFASQPPDDLQLVEIVDDKLLFNWNPVQRAEGYKLYYGLHSKNYLHVIDIGSVSSYQLEPISLKLNHYIAITSYTADGDESLFSDELVVMAVDDDRLPPEFLNFHPLKVRARKPFFIQCELDDPSGIWDKGVYLVWDNDGELIESSHQVKMNRSSGNTFQTVNPIPPQEPNVEFVYEIFAFDNDFDGGREYDRTLGGSFTKYIEIAENAQEIYVYPNPVANSKANFHIKLHDEAKIYMNIYDVVGHLAERLTFAGKEGEQVLSSKLRISSGVYIYRLEIQYENMEYIDIFRGKFAIVR